MGVVSFLGRIGSMIAPFTATVVGLLCFIGGNTISVGKKGIRCNIGFTVHLPYDTIRYDMQIGPT